MRLTAATVLLAFGCSSVPRTAGPGVPELLIRARPDVRIVALELVPGPGGLLLAGRIVAPQPQLALARPALAQGLDAAGAVLFERSVAVEAGAAPGRWTGPLPAVLCAELPRPPGLCTVRITLPGA